MEYAINLLREEIKDLGRKIDEVIDVKYHTERRGNAPSGASWNVSVESEMARLDKIHSDYEVAIEQCEKALEWIISND
jgi:hypothetical protein